MGIYRIFGLNKNIENYLEALGLANSHGNESQTLPCIISVVGAGGKSTLIEAVAEEYVRRGSNVIITTTTHIKEPEEYCDDIETLKKQIENINGRMLYFGRPVSENGIRKLKAPTKEDMARMIRERTCPIIIEADGSKGLPCKAPAEYEPVILPETDIVIGVLSKRCVGGRITDVCHRPEAVSRLLKKGINDIISDKDLDVLFMDSKGLKKGVLQGMRYVPVLRVG